MVDTPTQRRGITLSEGGFAPGTRVITTNGPTPVEALAPGDILYTRDASTGLLKPNPLTHIDEYDYDGSLVRIETRRAALHVHPAHRIPYVTKAIDYTRFQRAETLHERERYLFLNDWRVPSPSPTDTMDMTALCDDYEIRMRTDEAVHGHTVRATLPEGCDPCYVNSHTGYHFDSATFEAYRDAIEAFAEDLRIVSGRNQRARPFRFDTEDFVRFLGWFVTEGSTTWRSDRNSGTVQLAQQKPTTRQSIHSLLERMGFDFQVSPHRFRIGSIFYASLLEDLCGTSSAQRRLPDFVWQYSTDRLVTLFETLLAGDGNDDNTYYTASESLWRDLTRLVLHVGIKPRYTNRRGTYQVYCNDTNDGFFASEHVSDTPYHGSIYRLTVADTPLVMAGRDGKFQWCATSRVC